MNIVAVYGTLKQGLHNHRVMEEAKGKFLNEDYVCVSKLWNVGYPRILLGNDNKFLLVELYEVPDEGMKRLDWLEGYRGEGMDNHYNRVKVNTLEGAEVWIYEYNGSIFRDNDSLENYKEKKHKGNIYYNWK